MPLRVAVSLEILTLFATNFEAIGASDHNHVVLAQACNVLTAWLEKETTLLDLQIRELESKIVNLNE